MNQEKGKHISHEDHNISKATPTRQLLKRNKSLFSMIYIALFIVIFVGLISASFLYINNDDRERSFAKNGKPAKDNNNNKSSNLIQEKPFESCETIGQYSLSEMEVKILLTQVENDIARQESEAKKKRDQLLREFESSERFVPLEHLEIPQDFARNLTISKPVLNSMQCLVEFYDSHEEYLTFDEIKVCELVEFEYAKLFRRQMSSLFEIRRHLVDLVRIIQQNQQIVSSDQKKKIEEIIIRSSLFILKNLSFLSEKNPEYFIFLDEKLMEITELKNSIPMKIAIQQLAQQWEDNWKEMNLIKPSHKAIKRNHTTKAETLNDKVINQFSRIESSEEQQLKKETSETKRIQIKDRQDEEAFEDNQNLQIKGCNTGISSDNCQGNLNQLFVENGKNEKKHDSSMIGYAEQDSLKIEQDILDSDQLGLIQLTSEERDELIPLKSQVKILWKSSFYKKNFQNLQANNFYLAEKAPKKQSKRQL